MIEAGLIVAGEDIPVPYDRFRDRIMFPISDWRGRVIAFGGRALEKEVSAKYLNSPETPLFHKGATLYNIAAARKAAHKQASRRSLRRNFRPRHRGRGLCRRHRHGDGRIRRHRGAARHRAHRRAIGADVAAQRRADPVLRRRRCRPPRRLSRARHRAAAAQTRQEPETRHAARRPGPGRSSRSGGRDAIEDVLGAARPLAHVLWARESEQGPFDTPERRAALEARIGEVTNAIADEVRAALLPAGFFGAASPNVRAGEYCDAPAKFRRESLRRQKPPRRRAAPAAFAARRPSAGPGNLRRGQRATCGKPAASRPSRRDPAAARR